MNKLPSLGASLVSCVDPLSLVDTTSTLVSTAHALAAQALLPQLGELQEGTTLHLSNHDLGPLWQQTFQLQAVFESKQLVQLGLLQRLQGQSRHRTQYGVAPSRAHPPSSIYPLAAPRSLPCASSPTPAPAPASPPLPASKHRYVSEAGVQAAEHVQNILWNQTEMVLATQRAVQALPSARSPRQVSGGPC